MGSISIITVREFLGPINQFITNLLGKYGILWWEAFKKFLKKELINFNHDMAFDFNFSKYASPELISFDKDLGPSEVLEELEKQGRRMGTTEELISFMGLKQKGGDKDISACVFSKYGPNQIPCLIIFSKDDFGEFRMRILDNQKTARWRAGLDFLAFRKS